MSKVDKVDEKAIEKGLRVADAMEILGLDTPYKIYVDGGYIDVWYGDEIVLECAEYDESDTKHKAVAATLIGKHEQAKRDYELLTRVLTDLSVRAETGIPGGYTLPEGEEASK